MRPRDVFDEHPADLTMPDDGLRVWLTNPPGLFSRANVSHLGKGFADFLAGDAMRLLREHASPPFMFAHDWSSVRTYESSARSVLTQWGFDLRSDMTLVRIYLSPLAPKLVRMGATVACASLAVAGYDVRIVDNLPSALRAIGMRPRGA